MRFLVDPYGPPRHHAARSPQIVVGRDRGFAHRRSGNRAVDDLECALGALEKALPAVRCATGLAAVSVLLVATARAGDTILCAESRSDSLGRPLDRILARLGITACYADTHDVDLLEAALARRPALCLVAGRADPRLGVSDLVARCQRHGVRLAVDFRVLGPSCQRPLALGADVVLYTRTQYLEGHNLPVEGALVTRDAPLLTSLRFVRNALCAS